MSLNVQLTELGIQFTPVMLPGCAPDKKCTIRMARAIGIRAENANLDTWGLHDKVNSKSTERQRSLFGIGVTLAA